MATITPSDYTNRYNLVIDNSKVDSTLTNYPVKVLLTSSNFTFSRSLSTGKDIVFTDTSKNILDFEMVYFDSSNSLAEYHVKIDSVSSTADTTFYMYVGKSGVTTSLENKTATWDSNFEAVYHLGGGLLDSTSNNNDGTATGTSIINDTTNGKSRSFNGTSEYVELSNESNFDNLAEITVQAFIDQDTLPSSNQVGIVSKYWDGSNRAWTLLTRYPTTSPDNYGRFFRVSTDINNTNIDAKDISYTSPGISLITGTWSSSDNVVEIFANGVSKNTNTQSGNSTRANTTTVVIGAEYYNGTFDNFYDGDIREVRISDTRRSDAWIKADDYNLRTLTLLTITSYTPPTPPTPINPPNFTNKHVNYRQGGRKQPDNTKANNRRFMEIISKL